MPPRRDVWAVGRKLRGQPKKRAFVVAKVGIPMEYERYLCYLDADGDVARKCRAR